MYEHAASLGHLRAINDLGVMCYHGEGVERDFAKVAVWYERSGTKEDSCSLLYSEGGPGLPQDAAEAQRHLKRAADLGHGWARMSLRT